MSLRELAKKYAINFAEIQFDKIEEHMFTESRLSSLPPRPELVDTSPYDTEPLKDLEFKCDMSMKTKYSPLKVKPA